MIFSDFEMKNNFADVDGNNDGQIDRAEWKKGRGGDGLFDA